MMSFERGPNGRIRLRRMVDAEYDQRVRTLMLEQYSLKIKTE
jgi:hypothetical protein